MSSFMTDEAVIERIFHHIDHQSTDCGTEIWREPVDNYRSVERFDLERQLMRRLPMAFCPSAALDGNGTYIARTSLGTPLLIVRDDEGQVRGFRNACRHRGMQIAEARGKTRVFVCPYHAWTYGLDGKLKHIPGRGGFPGVEMDKHGLVAVRTEEKDGIVFVTQEELLSDEALLNLEEQFRPEQKVFEVNETFDEANWKLIAESTMEGYHIKSLHQRSFFPYGYDNLNLVELSGCNSRITFPFRRIERLRNMPVEERRIDGKLTYVTQIFPNAHVSLLSNHTNFVILEPESPNRTRQIIYRLSNRDVPGRDSDLETAKRDASFVSETGIAEDRKAVRSIQDSLAAGANSHFTFGYYEGAIVNFHKSLHTRLEELSLSKEVL